MAWVGGALIDMAHTDTGTRVPEVVVEVTRVTTSLTAEMTDVALLEEGAGIDRVIFVFGGL
jgi:hypothetical protein